MGSPNQRQLLFQVLNEIGIIHQLAVTEFNRRMPEGLHVSHFSVINHLCRLGDGVTPMNLASAFQITRATMTNTLKNLSQRELVEVRGNPNDGRSKLVFLTKRGRDFQERAIAAITPMLEQMSRDLPPSEIATTLPSLQKLRSYLDEHRSSS